MSGRRWLQTLGAAVALTLGGMVVWSLLVKPRDARVEAIRLHGYPVSLADLDAWYPAVPAAENAALIYTNAFALLATDPPSSSTGSSSGGFVAKCLTGTSWPPRGQLPTAAEKSELAELLAANGAALRLLHSVPASARSRYPVDLRDGYKAGLPHLAKAKRSVQLLAAEALLRASEGNSEQATEALLAGWRVTDSLAEEPALISFLVRVACSGILVARLEQALTLTPFAEAQLARLQAQVAGAERPRGLARCLAGERACGLSIFLDRRPQDVMSLMNVSANAGPQFPGDGHPLGARLFFGLYRAGPFQKDKACYLDSLGRQVEAAGLPYPARFTALGQSAAALTNPPSRWCIFSRMLLPALSKVPTRDADATARIRAAAVVLAVERFRQAHDGRLPESLAALVPASLSAIPPDPFDGKPLRYTRHASSYAVYSIGSDRQDNGGVDWNSAFFKDPRDIAVAVERPGRE